MTATLDELRRSGEISPLDDSFARSLSRLGGEARAEVLLASALVSRQTGLGDVCLDLPRLVSEEGSEREESDRPNEPGDWPALDAWLQALAESRLVARVDRSDPTHAPGRVDPSASTPLVLDEWGRLYLRRCFEEERQVAEVLLRLARAPEVPTEQLDPAAVADSIRRLMAGSIAGSIAGPMGEPETDWPRVAAAVAASKQLCVISGGPGTGKTSTAARLLAVLVEQALARDEQAPRIALAAPTGKAAARLGQAIARARDEMDCGEAVRAAIPDDAATLHRLLGLGRRGRPREGRLLRADVVLVDEASMIDLGLMSRLVAALTPDARLILLGDGDQLASVEAGAVFADVCGPGAGLGYSPELAPRLSQLASTPVPADDSASNSPVRDCVVRLRRSHRYGRDSGIGVLARSIRVGDSQAALEILDGSRFGDVARVEPEPGRGFGAALRAGAVSGYGDCLNGPADDPLERLRGFDRFRMLCAVREGPYGVIDLSARVDAALVAEGLLAEPTRGGSAASCPGRPILVTRNAPHLGLFNGDVGLVVADPSGTVRAWFEAGGRPRSFALSRLPPHESVFAMTVHKSQGSEFDEVVLVLPDEPLPLLTRELVYTAVTRARSRVVVHARADVLEAAISRRVSRASGLRDVLWPTAGDRGTV